MRLHQHSTFENVILDFFPIGFGRVLVVDEAVFVTAISNEVSFDLILRFPWVIDETLLKFALEELANEGNLVDI